MSKMVKNIYIKIRLLFISKINYYFSKNMRKIRFINLEISSLLTN